VIKSLHSKSEQLLLEVLTLTGHPVVGCAGGLNKTVFRLAALVG